MHVQIKLISNSCKCASYRLVRGLCVSRQRLRVSTNRTFISYKVSGAGKNSLASYVSLEFYVKYDVPKRRFFVIKLKANV